MPPFYLLWFPQISILPFSLSEIVSYMLILNSLIKSLHQVAIVNTKYTYTHDIIGSVNNCVLGFFGKYKDNVDEAHLCY